MMSTLHGLGVLLLQRGEAERGRDALVTCLEFWRRDGDLTMVARELNSLGVAHRALDHPDTARALLSESVSTARGVGDQERLASALSNLATLESEAGQHDRAIELLHEARALDAECGDAWALGVDDVNLAGLLLAGGRLEEAHQQLRRHAAAAVALGDPALTADVIGLFCSVFAERGDAERAARLLGAVESLRQQAELPMTTAEALALAGSVDKVRALPTAECWEANVSTGSAYGIEAALDEALAGTTGA